MSKETEGTQDANQPRDGGAGLAPPPEMAAIDAMVAGAEEKAARASAPEPAEVAPDPARSSQPSGTDDDEAQRIGAAVLPDAGVSRRARARMTLRIPDDSVPVHRAGSSPDLSSSIRMPSSPDLEAAADPAAVIRAMRIISVGEQSMSRSAMELSPTPGPVGERVPSAPSISEPTPIAPPSAMIRAAQSQVAPPEPSEEALTPDDILGESDLAPVPPPVLVGPPLTGPALDQPSQRHVPPPPVSGTHPIPTRVQITEAEPTPAPRGRMEAVIDGSHAPSEEVELSDEEIAPDSEKPKIARIAPPPPPPSVPPAASQPAATPSPLPVIAGPMVPGALGPVPGGAMPVSAASAPAATAASPEVDEGAVTRQMAAVRLPSGPDEDRSPFPSIDVPVELSEEPVEEAPPPSSIPTPQPPAMASGPIPPPPALGIAAERSQPAMQVPPPPPQGIAAERSQPALQLTPPPPPPLGIAAERSQPAVQLTPPPPPAGLVAPVKSDPALMGPPIAPPIGLSPPPPPVKRVPSQPSAVMPAGAPAAAATEPARRSAPDAVEVSDAELEAIEEAKKETKRAAPPPAPKPKRPAAETPAAPAVAAAPAAAAPADATQSQRPKGPPWWEALFADDFARSLDRLTPQQVAKEARFIEESLALQKGGVMLDLGCGSGQHAVELAARGYNVVGYDLSLTMLAAAQDEAQTRGQKLNLLQGDMREMAFEEMFDGVYSWATSFGYFDLEKNVDVIRRVHRALRSGGMFLLDIVNRDYIVGRLPSLAWFEGDGCVCMDDARLDSITSRLVVKRTLMLDDGRAREIEYSIRLYALHEIGKILNETGFKVVEVSGHPATNGVFMGAESPRLITLAEKR